MSDYTELGKITAAYFGFGGYDDAMMGLSLKFGGTAWGCGTFEGGWSFPPPLGATWTVADQDQQFSKAVRLLLKTLQAAKVGDIANLVGIPVEVTFDGTRRLKSWRVLTEVL